MRFLFEKKILFFLLSLLFVFIIFIISCSLTDIKKIVEDPTFNPKWDVDLKALVVDYSTSPISFKDFVEEKALDSPEVSISGLVAWPVASDPGVINGVMDIDREIDIDDDSTADFRLDGYYKADPKTLKVQIWLTDSGNNILQINSDCVNIQSITIEGSTINLDSPITYDNILNYYSTNFLDPSNEYYLDLADSGSADQLDFSIDVQLLNGSSPSYSGDTYTLNIKLVFNLGSDFGVVGEVINAGVLKSATDQPIPINDLPLEAIENFKLEFEYDSNLAFDLNMVDTFHGTDQTPSPASFSTIIDSGELSTSAMHGYKYVSGLKNSNDSFKFNDNVLDYGNMSLDLEISLPTPTGEKIRLETDSFLRVRIIVNGKATISL